MSRDAHDPVGLYVGTTSGEIWASRTEGAGWAVIARHLPEIYSVEAATSRDEGPYPECVAVLHGSAKRRADRRIDIAEVLRLDDRYPGIRFRSSTEQDRIRPHIEYS